MDNVTTNFQITLDQIIQIISIAVSIFLAIRTAATSTKKYELTEKYRMELLNWYSKTVEIMIEIIHHVKTGDFFKQAFLPKKTKLLSLLSTQIEIGRFYYPNIIKKDELIKEKPDAYQGNRHVALEFLVSFYNIAANADSNGCISKVCDMEKCFTSIVFNTIEPRKRNKKYSKRIEITIPEGESVENYIKENPEKISVFTRRYS